ncbi:MAG: ABC transporter substrate-binding protein [Alphaproteobacteria bacterium]|nr:ABC transporter substrate-binding protein [Alphaproteobacteria bacterium]
MTLSSLGGKIGRGRVLTCALAVIAPVAVVLAASAIANAGEIPYLEQRVNSGELPPMAERLPTVPDVTAMQDVGREVGRYGGDLKMLMGKSREVRQMVVYGYARLTRYSEDFELEPDILERFEVEDDRVYTLYLRPGHKWSDGHPFTAEDFRYYWDDVVNNKDLYPLGVPIIFLVGGETAKFEVIDETTVRYSWSQPNPGFLHQLAKARPPFIYRPAHYMKQFHARYTSPEDLAPQIKKHRKHNWVALHHGLDDMYKNTNPELPTLHPWINTTAAPAQRFVFVRNPFFHRVDEEGQQLPYIDRVIINIADSKIIPAKATAGETHLQARYLRFDNYTVLKKSEKRHKFRTFLWRTAKASHMTLYPNLTAKDPVWRTYMRDVRFRRALSLGINRRELNQVIYYGLALEAQNTVLPQSPLFREEYRDAWAEFDLDKANALLDDMGLTERDAEGYRILPETGQRLQIIVDTAGERSEEIDVLQLIKDSWARIGVAMFIKATQRDFMRNRVYSGDALMSVWYGHENGIATADMSPEELAPVGQHQLCWSKWGQNYETKGEGGEAVDMPLPKQLLALLNEWRRTPDTAGRERIWHEMLSIHADQVYTIGLISSAKQPVVVDARLRNVPQVGTWNWDPGAHFGIHRMDTFWFDEMPEQASNAPTVQ